MRGAVASTRWRLDAVPITTFRLDRPFLLTRLRTPRPLLDNLFYSLPPFIFFPLLIYPHSIHHSLLLHPHGFPRLRISTLSTRKGHLETIQVSLSPMWARLQQTRTPGMPSPTMPLPSHEALHCHHVTCRHFPRPLAVQLEHLLTHPSPILDSPHSHAYRRETILLFIPNMRKALLPLRRTHPPCPDTQQRSPPSRPRWGPSKNQGLSVPYRWLG